MAIKTVGLRTEDMIIDTSKVTTGYFTGGLGTLLGTSLSTASLSTQQKEYYFNLQYSSEDHFSVLYGHKGGSGSSIATTNSGIGQTQAVYNSYAGYLLRSGDIAGGFKLQGTGTTDASTEDQDVYLILLERAKMKDRLNPGNWTFVLSGSNSAGTAGVTIHLTDDSKVNKAVASPIGPKYRVMSGSKGSLNDATSGVKYGEVFPEAGCIVLSGAALSGSIPGIDPNGKSGSLNVDDAGVGFQRDSANDGTAQNALKLCAAIIKSGENQVFRAEEDLTSVTYFCRALSRDFNHSSHPSYTSGSEGKYQNPSFVGNPQTVITTIGLYNGKSDLVALGRLSSGLQKNYSTEAIIKVKLTY